MPWRVDILNEAVVAEIAALPVDMQARFLRLAERIASAGLDGIARALYVTAIGRRVVVVRAFRKKTQTTHAPRSNSRYGEPMRSPDSPVRATG